MTDATPDYDWTRLCGAGIQREALELLQAGDEIILTDHSSRATGTARVIWIGADRIVLEPLAAEAGGQ